MGARRTTWLMALLGLQLVLLVATFPVDALGTRMWHHVASLGVVLLLSGLFYKPLTRSRGVLALGILVTSVLAIASGFYLLYWKAGIRVDGYQDWGVFWHVAWSWAALVFFVQHTWINRVQWFYFIKRTLATPPRVLLHIGAYVALVVAFLVTWSQEGRTWFTNENYIVFSLRTWILLVVPGYLAWLVIRHRQRADPASSWAQRFSHWRVRGVLDVALVPVTALALLSGVPLLFFDAWLDAAGFKYVSKYWHVWPSTLFTVMVFVHGVQAWHTVKAHWRNMW